VGVSVACGAGVGVGVFAGDGLMMEVGILRAERWCWRWGSGWSRDSS